MNWLNQGFLKFIIILSLLPLLPVFLLSLTPAGLLLVAVIAYFTWPRFQRSVNQFFGGLGRGIRAIFVGIFRLIGTLVGGLFKVLGFGLVGAGKSVGWLWGARTPSSAQFMGWFERWRFLRSSHQGILIDGRSSRLSEADSYESLLVQGGMGRGKSSGIVLPNLLSLPNNKPSFVISDTSGELYQASSGYLASQGYVIRVLNLMDPAHSETYNPLSRATAPQDLAELAKTLVRSAGGRAAGQGNHDPFWDQSAEKLIRILAQCLQNQLDPSFRNLANLRHLVTSFDAHVTPQGQLGKIDQFVLQSTQQDQGTFQSYRAFVQGNLKTLQSVLMTADVALDAVATPEMAALTATNSVDFDELRQRPTALYVMVNQTQMDLYKFLLNLFYADLFRSLLRNQNDPGNPVWLWLDEFGHLAVPRFETFATTARKYKVAYALFLQSLGQLEGQYGPHNARTIIEGLGTELYLPGASLDTARNLEARLGRISGTPLMSANEIIRMKDNEALLLNSNRLPVLLRTKRYYQRADLRWRSRKTPAPLPQSSGRLPAMISL